jgi:predicted transcriptional regulator of viral defense system
MDRPSRIRAPYGPRSSTLSRPDAKLAALAGVQHGVLARSQALAAGLSAKQIRLRLESGHLIALHRGVYAVGHVPHTPDARRMAAVLAGGPQALLAQRSASEAYRLTEPIEGPMHVVALNARARSGIVFHRTRTLDARQRTIRDGIPITSVERTLVDLCHVVGPKQLKHPFDEADHRGLLDGHELERVSGLCRGRGATVRLRRLMASRLTAVADSRSVLERGFMRFCAERELPQPAANVPYAGFVVDLLWPQYDLVVELDSWRHHKDREAFENDRRRDAAIQLAGCRTVRVTDRRLRREPDRLEFEIRTLMASAPGHGEKALPGHHG